MVNRLAISGAVALGALILQGCVPISTIHGIPSTSQTATDGFSDKTAVGAHSIVWTGSSGDERLTMPTGYIGGSWNIAEETGVSLGFELPFRPICVLAHRRGSVSLEAGLSLSAYGDDGLADLLVGFGVSSPGLSDAPYIAYRHHWIKYADAGPQNIARFRQHIVFVGWAWDGGGKRRAIEAYYTWSDGETEPPMDWRGGGINVIWWTD